MKIKTLGGVVKMANETQRYNPQVFAAQRVYEKLTEPLKDLTPAQQVNTIAVGVGNLRRTLEDVVEKLKDRAVEEQKRVVLETDKLVQKTYAGLDGARKSVDIDAYDKIGTDVRIG